MPLIFVPRKAAIVIGVSVVLLAFLLCTPFLRYETVPAISDAEWRQILQSLFDTRNDCVLRNDPEALKPAYLTDERNGYWAYENEAVRARYLHDWAAKQGVKFLSVESTILLKHVKQVGRGYAFRVIVSTEYRYAYADTPGKRDLFRLGSMHSLDLVPGDDGAWRISREWYDDPLSDTMGIDVTEEMTDFILSQRPPDLSGLNERRAAAVEYADTYCGTASDGQNGYKYNAAYTDYNAFGGDCANFASQIYHECGLYRKNGTWNFCDERGTRAWVNAQGFKNYMVYSGRGSVIAKGPYEDVYQKAYQMLPGDFVAYIEKGKVTHISVVTGLDSHGYPLVNSHNADRYRVPWDVGWSGSGVSMYLIRVGFE